MNEVLQTDFKNESVTLEHKELKRIINNWRLLLIVCFLWALGAVLLLFVGFLSMQTIDRSNADYGIQYTFIFGGLWPLVTILSVISKTTWGRVIGIISCAK